MPKGKDLPFLDDKKILELEKIALKLRENIIEMLLVAQSGHSAGPLGMADIFSVLYFHILNIDPKNPTDPNRDRLVLSNGHICPVLYAALIEKGFLKKSGLQTLRKFGSNLQGHPHINTDHGIETSSGPLGQGLSQAIGMALASKMDKRNNLIFCITGDGELDEGQIWEAALFGGNSRLDNLIWIIDRNNIQIDGYTENVMPLEKLKDKLESFNWYTIEIDGHNISEIAGAINHAKSVGQRPTAIIAHTIPGKDVDFMEYKFSWHGKAPSESEAKTALDELRTLKGRLEHATRN